jgi:hypothetical protein
MLLSRKSENDFQHKENSKKVYSLKEIGSKTKTYWY